MDNLPPDYNNFASLVNPWGERDLMVVCALRYCMGRRTYVVFECVDWLIEIWEHLSDTCQAIVYRDLMAEINRDDEARSRGDKYLPLGDDCDREQWDRLKNFIEEARCN